MDSRKLVVRNVRHWQQKKDFLREVIVNPKLGLGDVVGPIDGRAIQVECKGGTIYTTHTGQLSRLRNGLCEAVGFLMAREPDGAMEVAAVPWTSETEKLARRIAKRCHDAGVEIALAKWDGQIIWSRNLV